MSEGMVDVTGFQTVCRTDELKLGESKRFVVDAVPVSLFHLQDGFYALDDRCPHAGASLALGYLESDVVRCRIHHWGFCIRSGVYVDRDAPSLNAQSIEVRIQGNEVQIRRPSITHQAN